MTAYPSIIGLAAAIVATAIVATPALAQSSDEPEPRQLAGLVFGSVDADGDELATYSEMLDFSEQIVFAADTNADGAMSLEEFSTWDFGMQNIARERGREDAMASTIRFVHDLWDRDNDRLISKQELERGIIASMDYADLDGDRTLTRTEFLDGFVTNIAYRSSLVDAQ